MIGREALKEAVRGKRLLLDACFLINATKPEFTDHYKEIIAFFIDAECELTTSSVSYFEALRTTKTCKDRVKAEGVLRDIVGVTHVRKVDQHTIETATKIGYLYSFFRQQFSRVSLADCINAALLTGDGDLLVTEDLADYPTAIFDCCYLWPMSINRRGAVAYISDRSISAIGIFSLDQDRLATEIEAYNKSCEIA